MPKQPTDNEGASSSSTVKDETNKKEFRMPTPPPDWEYRCLLKDIANAMRVEDVKVAKLMFKGEFKSQLSEKIVDASDLFDVLEKRGFLDSNNLLYLQSVLAHAKRHDLFEMVAKFASETLQNAVHFQKPPGEPAPGHMYAYLHVKGQAFSDLYTRSSLEDLRSKAAKIMGLLPQYILFPGVELGESFLVTMMISLEHIESLKTAMKISSCRNDLASLGVDEVRIGDETWNIEGCEEYELVESEQQAKQQMRMKKLHEDLEKCKDILQKREIEMIDLKKAMGGQTNNNDELHQLKHELIYAKHMLENKEKDLKEKEAEIYQLSHRTEQMSTTLYKIKQNLNENKHNYEVAEGHFFKHNIKKQDELGTVRNHKIIDKEVQGFFTLNERTNIFVLVVIFSIVTVIISIVVYSFDAMAF